MQNMLASNIRADEFKLKTIFFLKTQPEPVTIYLSSVKIIDFLKENPKNLFFLAGKK